MPKFKIVCFILAAVLAAVGTVLVVRNLSNDFVPPDKVLTEVDPNTYLDLTEDIDITDRSIDVREFLFIAHKILLSGKGFKGVSTGKSTAVGGIEQNVLNTRIVVGEFGNKRVLKEMVTKGIVSNAYQLYLVGTGEQGNYIFRSFDRVKDLSDVDWADDAQPLSMQAFYNKFGHRSDKLTSYILNWETVLSGEFVGEENGLYTFRYILDTETAPADLKYEMITNGGLDDFPTFSKCEIYVTMDAEFNIKSLRTDCAYQATTMGINAGCTEDITEVFEPYEEELDLPYNDFFEPYLGKTGGDIVTEPTALEMLMQMFSPYLNGTDLQVKLSVNNDGEALTDAFVSVSGLDISDLTKLSVSLNLGQLNASYNHGDGKLLLQYQDFCGSTTLDGLTELADTFSALLEGDGLQTAAFDSVDTSELEAFDINSLLDNLSYVISADKSVCTVSLPISIGDVDIDAKVIGLLNGENYVFDYADINIGELNVHASPEAWTPLAIREDAPEILGLTDLINNGKLSLHADVTLPIFDTDYQVEADVLADLGNSAVKVNATLGSNGTIELCYVDGVVYAAFGELRFRLDTAKTDSIEEFVNKISDLLLQDEQNPLPEFNLENLLAQFGGFEAVTVESGKVALILSVNEMEFSVILADRDGRWNVESISAVGGGIDATLAPTDFYGEVTAPTDADSFADVSELVDTFAEPVLDLINSEDFGADFDIEIVFSGETYYISGSIMLEADNRTRVMATVYNRGLGIIDADVTLADGIVYVTVNGVSLAFAAGETGSEEEIIAALQALSDNEQIRQLLDEQENIKVLVETVTEAIDTIRSLDVSSLLTVDFSQFVKDFTFENGRLSMSIDGAPIGLNVDAKLTLSVLNGRLAVEAVGEIANLRVTVNAALSTDVYPIADVDPEKYLLTLHGEAMGAELDITADFVNMDIWANVHIRNEELLLRLADGKLYVVYGGAKVSFDIAELDGIVTKIKNLTNGDGQSDLPALDLLTIFAALSSDLLGADPNLSLDYGNVSAHINFVTENYALRFDSITVDVTVDGKEYNAKFVQQHKPAVKADIDGEFIDGNALADKLLDAVTTFKNADGVVLDAVFNVTVGTEEYSVNAEINCNGGVCADILLRDKEGLALVCAKVCLVDGLLYVDINGIRQATELPENGGNLLDKFDFAQIKDLLEEFRGENDVLDSIIDAIQQLPEDLNDIIFAKVVESLTFEGDSLTIKLALDQFGLEGATLNLDLGDKIAFAADGLSFGDVSMDIGVTAERSAEPVVAPDAKEYTTGLTVELSNGMRALLRLDLLNKCVDGTLLLDDRNTVLFRYEQGVVYIQYGNLNAKAEVADVSHLMSVIGKFVTLPELSQTDELDLAATVKKLLKVLSYSRALTEDGYEIDLVVDGTDIAVRFVCTDDSVTLAAVKVVLDSDVISDITVRQDDSVRFESVDMSREFVDITDVADIFAEPLARLLRGSSYGAEFGFELKLDNKVYDVSGTFVLDENKYIKVTATVYDGDIGVINADVTVADGGVFLTVNGISVAFKLSGDNAETDFGAAIDELLANEQIGALLGEHEDLQKLVEQLQKTVKSFTDLDVGKMDFTKLLRAMRFDGQTLTVEVNASEFNLGNFNVELSNSNDNLAVLIKDFALEGVSINNLSATVRTDTVAVEKPNPANYILYLQITGAGITANVGADLYNMDIWANINYVNNGINGLPIDENAQIRFVNKKLYVKLNNIALVFDATDAEALVKRISTVFGSDNAGGSFDLNTLLSGLVFDLAGAHRIGYVADGVDVSVNFACSDNLLTFSDVTVAVGDQTVKAVLGKEVSKMVTSGVFVDGNKLVDKLASLAERFKDAQGVEIENLTASVNINKNVYKAVVSLRYNDGKSVDNKGISVDLKLYDKADVLLVNAQLTLVKKVDENNVESNVLYLDVNGIKQAIKLAPTSGDSGEKTDLDIFAMLDEFKGVNDTLDGVIDTLKALPDKLANIGTVSNIVKALALDGEKIVLTLNDVLGVGDVELGIDADNCELTLKGLVLADIAINIESVKVDKCNEAVLAPKGDFTTELNVDLGKYGSAAIMLDLYSGEVKGFVKLFGKDCNRIDLLYCDGTSNDTSDGKKLYLNLGKVGAYFNIADTDALMSALSPFVSLPSTELSAKDIAAKVFEILSDVERDVTGGGYSLKINLNGTAIAVSFNKQAQFNDLTVSLDGTEIVVKQPTSGNKFNDVNKETAGSVDITSLAQVFIPAINSLVSGSGYKVDISKASITFNGKQFELSGSLVIDSDRHIQVKAAVQEDATTIINADVTVVGGGVYLTVNGVSVAFKTGDDSAQKSETDIFAALDKLQKDPKLQDILSVYPELKDLIGKLCSIAQSFSEFDVTTLDLSSLLQEMSYDDGKKQLSLTVDASEFGLGPALQLKLSAQSNELSIDQLSGLTVESLAVTNISATVSTYAAAVETPNPANYILNLHITGAGIAADVSVDLYNMEIFAKVKYNHDAVQGINIKETLLVHFVENTLYLQAGDNRQISLKFATKGLKDAVGRLVSLITDESPDMNFDIKDILSKLSFDLTGENPAITYKFGTKDTDIVSVNFTNTDGVLSFGSITATFGDITLTAVTQTTADIEKPSENVEDYTDGNKLLDVLCNVLGNEGVRSIKDNARVQTTFDLTLVLDGSEYTANVTLVYNNGISVALKIYDKEDVLLVNAQLTLVKKVGEDNVESNVLYLDVNGIKQAIKLAPTNGDRGEFCLDDLTTALDSYRGIHAALDAVIDFVQGLPGKLRGLSTVSDIVSGIKLNEQNKAVLTVDGTELGLASDVTLTLGTDSTTGNVTFAVDSIVLNGKDNKQALALTISSANLLASQEAVSEPSAAAYVTDLELGVTLTQQNSAQAAMLSANSFDNFIDAVVRLDLFNKVIYVKLGNTNASRLKLKLEDIDSVKDMLGKLDVSLPELGGDIKNTIKSLLEGLKYSAADSGCGYELTFSLDGIDVKVKFNIKDDAVSLGSVSVDGGSFNVSAAPAVADGFGSTDLYFDAADVLTEYVDAIKALKETKNYAFNFNGTITINSNAYKITNANVNLVGSDSSVDPDFSVSVDSIKCGETTLVTNGKVCRYGGNLYVSVGWLKLKIALDNKNDDPEAIALDELDSTLDGLKGYNDSLDDLLELVKAVAKVDLLSLNITDLVTIDYNNDGLQLSVHENVLKLKVNGSDWTVPEITATVQPTSNNNGLTNGLKLIRSGFNYNGIEFKIDDLTVTNEGRITEPSDSWITDFDIKVGSDTDISNTIHVRLDFSDNGIFVYALIESKGTGEDPADNLYINYNVTNKKLSISNHKDEGGVSTSVAIGTIEDLINEIQNIVNSVVGQETELPNLFGNGVNLEDILDSLKFGSDIIVNDIQDNKKQGIGVSLQAMGAKIGVVLCSNSSIAGEITFDENGMLGDTKLYVESCESTHSKFVDEINGHLADHPGDYVSLDEVLSGWFHGKDEDPSANNGVIYDLVNTNAWRFDFGGNADISVKDPGSNKTDKYRITQGSYIVFYFNKSETPFGINELIDAFNPDNQKKESDKDNAYKMLFDLLNSLQFRAKLTIQKQADGEQNYSDLAILDVALLRTQLEGKNENGENVIKPKSRLYISYDGSETKNDPNDKNPLNGIDKIREGVFNATLSLDSLQDVIGLKDALDSVLDGAIGKLIGSVKDMISDVQSNMPKLQLGYVARLLNSVSTVNDGLNLSLCGSAISSKLGDIRLNVAPYTDEQSDDRSANRGRGLTLNELLLSYDNISINLTNVVVSASTFSGGTDSTADERTYDYVKYGINSYLKDHGSETDKTPESGSFDKNNVAAFDDVVGYDMSSYMEFDSIRELMVGLIITASDRTFALSGAIEMNVKIPFILSVNYKMNITLLVDIEGKDSYWALLIDRPRIGNFASEGAAFGDQGGKSYLLFDSRNGGTFSIARHSYERFKQDLTLYTYGPLTIPTDDFMANIMTYVMELFNFSSTIRNLMESKLELKEFGIEDLLDEGNSYQYVKSDKRFDVKLKLKVINNMFDTATLNIFHEGNMDDVGYATDESGDRYFNTAGVRLSNLKINTTIVSFLKLNLDLNLLSENTPGLAKEYVTGHNYSWS